MKKTVMCIIALVLLLTAFTFAVPVQSFSGVYVDDNMQVFHEGLAAVCSGGKWGYVDINGNIAIPFQYSTAFPFSEDKAFVLKDDGLYACIDKSGSELFTLECTAVYPFSEGVARFVREGQTGFVGIDGIVIGEGTWIAAHDAKEGFIAVKDENGWGYIKTDGTVSVKGKYDAAEDYREGLAYVTLGNDGYIMDAEGNPYLYGAASGVVEDLIKMKGDEGCGFMNKTGKAVIEPVYEDVGIPANSRIPVLINGLWGYMDYTGTLIIQPQWTYAWPYVDGIARVYTANGTYAFIDNLGNQITEETFSDARDLSNGRAAVCIEGQWGYLDRLGTLTVGCQYEYAGNYSQNGTVVKSGSLYYILNDKGEKVIFGLEPAEKADDAEEQEPAAEEEAKPKLKLRQTIALTITGVFFVYDAGLATIRLINVRRRRWQY